MVTQSDWCPVFICIAYLEGFSQSSQAVESKLKSKCKCQQLKLEVLVLENIWL